MSPIALGLDLLLVTLLLTALYVGLKLNRQLKALRAGQAGFVKAVTELDTAAARAEAGLKALRAASESAHDELLTRIETARGLIARLDSANDKAAALAEAAAMPAPPPRPASLFRPQLRLEPAAPPAPPRTEPVRTEPVRARAAAHGLDEDLFEAAPDDAPVAPKRRLGQRL